MVLDSDSIIIGLLASLFYIILTKLCDHFKIKEKLKKLNDHEYQIKKNDEYMLEKWELYQDYLDRCNLIKSNNNNKLPED